MTDIEPKPLPVSNSNTSKRELVTNCIKGLGGHLVRICYLDELNLANFEHTTS